MRADGGGEAVRMTRTIEAPPEQVYRAFMDPAQLRRWFGPGGFEVVDAEIEPRVGGRHQTTVTGPRGISGRFVCEIRELVPDERIVMTWNWVFDTPPATADPRESLLTVTFHDAGRGRTELTLLHERLGQDPPDDAASVGSGWVEALDKLVALHAAADRRRFR
jgi:uncharacterized protein YndB with AHSA1/START domain